MSSAETLNETERLKDARIEFLRGPGGEVAWLRVGGRVHRRE